MNELISLIKIVPRAQMERQHNFLKLGPHAVFCSPALLGLIGTHNIATLHLYVNTLKNGHRKKVIKGVYEKPALLH